tara:strand:+ start:211 stop:492 length:282 start_codon:yes stop_codon:yes gene_type:complete
MTWFDIIKGRWISRKDRNNIEEAITSVEGVTIRDLTMTRKGHMKYGLTYQGEHAPTNAPVDFTIIISTSSRDARIKRDIKSALERRNVFIGEW